MRATEKPAPVVRAAHPRAPDRARVEEAMSGLSPFEALLRYGFARDRGAVRLVLEFVARAVQRARPREPDDLRQSLLLKLVAAPENAQLLARRLALHNPGLAAALDALPADTAPAIAPGALVEADRQLEAYVAAMIRNAERDRARRERRTTPLLEPELLQSPSPQLDDNPDLLGLRARILDEISQDTSRPAWLDQALGEVQSLAEGARTMDDLTAACVADDAELAAAPPAEARVRARNRLQQRHKRAREHLLRTTRGLVAAGALTVDEGRDAEKLLLLLKRRQNRPRGPSGEDSR